jgi:hypothetical protein
MHRSKMPLNFGSSFIESTTFLLKFYNNSFSYFTGLLKRSLSNVQSCKGRDSRSASTRIVKQKIVSGALSKG